MNCLELLENSDGRRFNDIANMLISLKSHLEVQCVPIDGLTSKYAKKKKLDPVVPCTNLSDFRHVPIVEIKFSDR